MWVLLNHLLQARRARSALQEGRLEDAVSIVVRGALHRRPVGRSLASALIKALSDRAREHLRRGNLTEALQDANAALLLGGRRPSLAALRNAVAAQLRASRRKPAESRQPGTRFLLWLEGMGTYLILFSNKYSLGRIGSSLNPDIPLFGTRSGKVAEIFLAGEAHVLVDRSGEIKVNGTNVIERILRPGDVIAAGGSAFRYSMPSPWDGTGVLKCEGPSSLPGRARWVFLLDRFIMIGRAPGAHLQVPAASGTVLLFRRNGRLFLQEGGPGASRGPTLALRPGKRVEAAGLSLTVTEDRI